MSVLRWLGLEKGKLLLSINKWEEESNKLYANIRVKKVVFIGFENG